MSQPVPTLCEQLTRLHRTAPNGKVQFLVDFAVNLKMFAIDMWAHTLIVIEEIHKQVALLVKP